MHCELDIDKSDNLQRKRELTRVRHDRVQLFRCYGIWWQNAGAVARMHTRLLDMLHHSTNVHVLTVAQRVYIKLVGVFKEFIDQDWAFGRNIHRLRHVFRQCFVRVADFHRPTTEHV